MCFIPGVVSISSLAILHGVMLIAVVASFDSRTLAVHNVLFFTTRAYAYFVFF